MAKAPRLTRNLVSYIGLSITAVAFTIGVVLVVSEILFENRNPYSALVTYLVVPAVLGFGVLLTLLGMFLEWRRRRKTGLTGAFPVIDLNKPRTGFRLLVAGAALTAFFVVSAVGTYRGFVFTESVEFCGTTCHSVMQPEYEAYQTSPHARVACVECHIGGGADWYVRSKVSGLRQVWRTLTNSYELPIEVPIANLRPARETCEHCHWPAFFSGSVERVRWHFWYDDESTPSVYHMLMHVGGVNPATGRTEGIHWHTSGIEVVRYWPRDRERLEIPWVEVQHADGSSTIFQSEDAPEGGPPPGEIRVMDCIDCHNRPAHIYRPPQREVNLALQAGRLDRGLTAIKANAVDLLNADYGTLAEARQAIETGLRSTYSDGAGPNASSASVEAAISVVSDIYEQTNFPVQGVNWRTYPDHIGHTAFPGCFRCHDGEHAAESGATISMECSLCHDFVRQASGDAAFEPVVYETRPWEHPEGEPYMHEGFVCTDCHAPHDQP